ncbi:MAG: hypothetical protein Q9221_009125 [Calogaya cf. arnoldii]
MQPELVIANLGTVSVRVRTENSSLGDEQITKIFQWDRFRKLRSTTTLKVWFTIKHQKVCRTFAGGAQGGKKDYYWHNDCIHWSSEYKDFCDDFTVEDPPAGIEAPADYRFCYKFHGDSLEVDEGNKDQFVFATDKRDVPRIRDFDAGEEEVAGKCGELCGELGMKMWRSKKGGWFNRMDSFHIVRKRLVMLRIRNDEGPDLMMNRRRTTTVYKGEIETVVGAGERGSKTGTEESGGDSPPRPERTLAEDIVF